MVLVNSGLIKELYGINYKSYYHNYYDRLTMEERYNEVMKNETGTVLASLIIDQHDGIKLLKKNGFKAVGSPRRNPNSGNRIILFIKKPKPCKNKVVEKKVTPIAKSKTRPKTKAKISTKIKPKKSNKAK